MERKNKKAVIIWRVIFAVVTLAYIVGTILVAFVFDMNESFKLMDAQEISIKLWNDKVWDLQIIGAKTVTVRQILCTALPGVLFVFSLIGWSLDRPAKKEKESENTNS